MIVVTGAAGFIGSCLLSQLNKIGRKDIVIVDDFSNEIKNKNLANKQFMAKVERFSLFDWLKENHKNIDFIFHIGARTDTTEFDYQIFEQLNINYSKQIWQFCADKQTPLVYASSAATYGIGEQGYDDDESKIHLLKPLNPYGESKNEFDKWVLAQKQTPPRWYGLKFFNVYGPNEYHKGRMASVIFHAFNQISQTKSMKLFRSHHPDYKDGEQLRDFIYVKDVVSVCLFFLENAVSSGIYNLGTGKARTFLDLARNTFKALKVEENINFVDTPLDIRDKYQYFTQANMSKLQKAGYTKPFYSLEEGISDYVQNYLSANQYF
ncbi:ADP-glyceromanno-heptose 6-epimerase [Thermoflexibacter ruber]|uniref:ADP-L-glycero-D-manno-heptose-6-epimerase n=1 Tax=Thermoflexibacter ruber TaxID=1003 RepID=A0A1I2H1A2_9BACT|nr:ADP-glyceromanno-heptose 6-epimerase [Thermoflexibacter ruber]SFF23855.1 ADP-glyceromanno-heptose 6-epimerase precursor [Thermoflexibacter ruber]